MGRVAGLHRLGSGRRRIGSAASAGAGLRRGRLLTVCGLLGASVLTVAIALQTLQPTASHQETLPAFEAKAQSAAPAPASPSAHPVINQGILELEYRPTHIRYPAVGMDQSVLPLSSSAQESGTRSITPPQTLEAYWLTAYGSPGRGSVNTTYIVGHSSDGVVTAFNNLSSRARVGDQLTVTTADGPQPYQVLAVSTENKSTLKDSQIWAKVPGKVVLVSCHTADLWGTNIIVEAIPLSTGG